MSVSVEQVSKLYGQQKALDQVSFSVSSGQVVGFLGPNGAGKSTMMKIISCFLPQSSGKVTVDGFDVREESLEVRRRVGYLPENNPLYADMYVREFLGFIGGIQVPRRALAAKINELIERTGLGPEQHKKIGALSKGYRQRVGLAQALIHDPRVLILDEPTTGLDPNQLVGIRDLIREIGRDRTVMLSTHIMQEVEAVCDRVIIINKGKIVADEATTALKRKGASGNCIRIGFDRAADVKALRLLAGVRSVEELANNEYRIRATDDIDLRKEAFRYAVDAGLTILNLQQEQSDLESVFRDLTARVQA
ncbi:MAG: gliding motility-associated ABC transporter ATP-binding subunit GldA [Bacteroidota bacterium]